MEKCSRDDCTKIGTCIISIGDAYHTFCTEHIPNYANGRTKFSCKHENCPFVRVFGSADGRAEYCRIHMKPGMIHIAYKFCDVPGCPINPTYGFVGTRKPLFCKRHQIPGTINSANKLCAQCTKQATHNFPIEKKAIFCSGHAQPGMINVKTKRCIEPGCALFPSYNVPGQKTALYCLNHAKPNMINIKHPNCEYPDCTTQATRHKIEADGTRHNYCATHGKGLDDGQRKCEGINEDGTHCTTHPAYDLPGTKSARFCKKHAQVGMINVRAILCSCGKRPSFNLPGQPPRFCEKCKTEGMINVINPRCEFPGCQLRPSFAHSGEQKARFCIAHKEEGMENVAEARCAEPNCPSINPCFGYRPENLPDRSFEGASSSSSSSDTSFRYCSEHKKPGMEDLLHPYCACPRHKRATFVVPNDPTNAHYCFVCRPPNAITVNPICEGSSTGEECDTRASYGPLFSPARHCATHGKECDANGRRLYCEFANRYPVCSGSHLESFTHSANPPNAEAKDDNPCKLRPTFSNRDDNFPTHCPAHAPIGSREVESGECIQCHMLDLIDHSSRLCIYCETGGSRAATRDRHHRKEMRMMELLAAEDFAPTAHDQTLPELLQQGIKSRPDFFFDYDDMAIILEVDEFQHANRGVTFISNQVPVLLEFPPDYTCQLELAPIDPDKIARKQLDAASVLNTPVPPPIVRRGYTRNHELARMIHIQHALNKPTFFVRYNPDEFIDSSGKRHGISRGTDRDMIAVNLVKKISILSSTEQFNQSLQPGWNLYVAYLCYNGQAYGAVDSFRVNPDITKVERYAL